jgi:Flp pilus assembly protein TadG
VSNRTWRSEVLRVVVPSLVILLLGAWCTIVIRELFFNEPEKPQDKGDRVVLTGTAGQAYCTVTDDDGNRFSVTPAVPGEIEANVGGMSGVLSATCVKAYAQGSLTMKLVVDGEVVKKKTTTAPRGIVSAAY